MERICCNNCFTKYFLINDVKGCPKCKSPSNKNKKVLNLDNVDLGKSVVNSDDE